MTPTKVKMKSDSDNDIEFNKKFDKFDSAEIEFNKKFDRILYSLDALNLSKKDHTVIIDKSKNSVFTRADDPNQIIRNTNPSSKCLLNFPSKLFPLWGNHQKLLYYYL